MTEIVIHVFPEDKRFHYFLEGNKSIKVLKDDLIERKIIKEGEYHVEMNNIIISDDKILRCCEVFNKDDVNIVRNDYFKTEVESITWGGNIGKICTYLPIREFKVLEVSKNGVSKTNENGVMEVFQNKIIKVCNYSIILYLFYLYSC